ncbi:MAG: hypothetical protein ABGZ35_23220 [Planctomycetaceae bacterium]
MTIGIDNGITGGIVVLDADGEVEACYKMPWRHGRLRKCVDEIALSYHLEYHQSHSVYYECPAGAKSHNAAVSMADSFARTQAVIMLLRMDGQEVPPKTWQKTYWKKKQGADINTKDVAIAVAESIWPDVTFIPSGCSVPHTGLVDAALIARWGMLQEI